MKTCFTYIRTSMMSDEKICTGVILIKPDGKHLFLWSKSKVDLALSIMSSENREGIKSIIDMTYRAIESTKLGMEWTIEYTRKNDSGFISWDKPSPVSINGDPEEYIKSVYNKYVLGPVALS